MEPRAPQFYTVPAGTPSTRCKGPTCQATIFFITSPRSGRPLPIHCDVDGGRRPSMTNDRSQLDAFDGGAEIHDGRGVSHFADCPDAEPFQRSERKMTTRKERTAIADAIDQTLNFPRNRKHLAVAVDVDLLRRAVDALRGEAPAAT